MAEAGREFAQKALTREFVGKSIEKIFWSLPLMSDKSRIKTEKQLKLAIRNKTQKLKKEDKKEEKKEEKKEKKEEKKEESESESESEEPRRGIPNLGNTCWANGIYQMLYDVDIFKKFIMDGTWNQSTNLHIFCNALKQIFLYVDRKAQYTTANLKKILETIPKLLFKNNYNRQQDATEFFTNLTTFIPNNSDIRVYAEFPVFQFFGLMQNDIKYYLDDNSKTNAQILTQYKTEKYILSSNAEPQIQYIIKPAANTTVQTFLNKLEISPRDSGDCVNIISRSDSEIRENLRGMNAAKMQQIIDGIPLNDDGNTRDYCYYTLKNGVHTNFVGDYLIVSFVRKTVNTKLNTRIEIENEISIVEGGNYALNGIVIHVGGQGGGHYYYESIKDGRELNDQQNTKLSTDREYVYKNWSLLLYKRTKAASIIEPESESQIIDMPVGKTKCPTGYSSILVNGVKKCKQNTKKMSSLSSSKTEKKPKCPKGQRRNKKTGECEPSK
jgi:hypothetical protein